MSALQCGQLTKPGERGQFSPERPWASPVGNPTRTGSGAPQQPPEVSSHKPCGGRGDVAAGADVGGADAGFGEFELDGVGRFAGPRPGRRRRSGPVRSRWRAGRSGPGRRTSCRRCRSPAPGGRASWRRAVRRCRRSGIRGRSAGRARRGLDGRVQFQPEFPEDVQVGAEPGGRNDDVGLQGPAVRGAHGDGAVGVLSREAMPKPV